MFDRIFANYLAECGKLSEQNLKDIFPSRTASAFVLV